MVRIRIIKSFNYKETNYQAGTVVDISPEVANRWCGHGLAMEDKSMDGAPEVKSTGSLVCPVCGRECKSDFGLKSHMRTHK